MADGPYNLGGQALFGFTNRVALTKPLTLRSLNGPQHTQIVGSLGLPFATRCVYLTNGCSLFGFTLSYGSTMDPGEFHQDSGGGVFCESPDCIISNCFILQNTSTHFGGGVVGGLLVNCTLSGNSSFLGGGVAWATLDQCVLKANSAIEGGGASESSLLNRCTLAANTSQYLGGGGSDSTLNNCVLTNNSAAQGGGGAAYCTLNNCTLVWNSAQRYGGGTDYCTLNNCIALLNATTNGLDFNYSYNTVQNYCCTLPLPLDGFGNLTNPPLFVNLSGGNLRLQSNSPCINAGRNQNAPGGLDLDGNPRIAGGTVDIGAYEFPNPTSSISYAWLAQYGLPLDGSADAADPDQDGMNNWQEWVCRTIPTNALSVLRLRPLASNGTSAAITWESVPGVNYDVERGSAVSGPFAAVATKIAGRPGTTTIHDTNIVANVQLFYRVRVD